MEAPLKPSAKKKPEALKIHDYFQYTGPDGTTYHAKYTVNEDCFIPEGPVVPNAPEILAGILNKLELYAADPEEKNQRNSRYALIDTWLVVFLFLDDIIG